MVSRRFLLAVAGHCGVFLCGLLVWAMAQQGHFATALVLGLAALFLISLLMRAYPLRPRRRPSVPESTFVSEQSRLRLEALIDQTPSPLLLQEDHGRLIAVNRAARKLFDASSEVPRLTRETLLGPAGRITELKGQIDWAGTRYAVQSAWLDQAALAILVDITPEVRAAEAHALRDLLRVLNHELMNALTPVASMSRSALDLIRDNTPDSIEAARGALERVVARTEGLVGFVESYRVLTRLPPPDLGLVRFAPFIEEIAQEFRARWQPRGVSLEVEALGDGDITMDRVQIRLCLTNLLNNAAEAALERDEPRVRLGTTATTGIVTVSVEDSGGGVSPELAETVFLPFYTTKSTGTGVGLTLARQILQGHGCALSVSASRTLSGAHFSFSLPCAA
jgi:signal transduction histidine kinase